MQWFRKILWPFAWLYAIVVWLRNKFFDWHWLPSKEYDTPVVCVGNLSVGGTGKTPMIEYLVRLLKDDFKIATLSRGYKRKTSGYHLLDGTETAQEVGDEPLQFKTKFPQIQVAVDANRQHGIARLRKLQSPPEIILLDDAFQHRKVKPRFSILLTSFDCIFPKDLMLPAGNLREPKSGAKRAKIIVVTKCPKDLSKEKQDKIIALIKPKSDQMVYFSFIDYADKITNNQREIGFDEFNRFCLVTGIAKPEPLVAFLKHKNLIFKHREFPDHHNFSADEIASLKKEPFILTTEKDFMRLKDQLPIKHLFYLPIKQRFIGDKRAFDQQIHRKIQPNFDKN